MKASFYLKTDPGIELLSRWATPQVSLPLPRFTGEFGMESQWDHGARDTRKLKTGENTFKTAQNKKEKVKMLKQRRR